jgi:predicted nucleic-acid-binding protein
MRVSLSIVGGPCEPSRVGRLLALFVWKDSAAEFADCLVGMRHLELGCQATASFDQRALNPAGFIAA